MQPIEISRLTKRFLLTLQPGQYIVSNIHDQDEGGRNLPAFRESVAPPGARDGQDQSQPTRTAGSASCSQLSRLMRSTPNLFQGETDGATRLCHRETRFAGSRLSLAGYGISWGL